jgi:type 1 fimbriae regulatory protein FimB/type 1 fimbriae regulatory protein FimE
MGFETFEKTTPTIVNSTVARTREYLTGAEVEALMVEARKSGRYGHRDATMILIAYRHVLRAVEVCDLQWHQVELATGRLHVRRAKRGTPSVHPIQGDLGLSVASLGRSAIRFTHRVPTLASTGRHNVARDLQATIS